MKPPSSATAMPSTNATGSPSSVTTCGDSGAEGGDHFQLHHSAGCDERLLAYLRATASLLAILGYCVLAFLKMCFLGKYHSALSAYWENKKKLSCPNESNFEYLTQLISRDRLAVSSDEK